MASTPPPLQQPPKLPPRPQQPRSGKTRNIVIWIVAAVVVAAGSVLGTKLYLDYLDKQSDSSSDRFAFVEEKPITGPAREEVAIAVPEEEAAVEEVAVAEAPAASAPDWAQYLNRGENMLYGYFRVQGTNYPVRFKLNYDGDGLITSAKYINVSQNVTLAMHQAPGTDSRTLVLQGGSGNNSLEVSIHYERMGVYQGYATTWANGSSTTCPVELSDTY